MAKRDRAPSGNSRPNNRRLKALHPYNDLSDRVCEFRDCRRQIKTRMVLLRDAKICYRHHCSLKKKGKARA